MFPRTSKSFDSMPYLFTVAEDEDEYQFSMFNPINSFNDFQNSIANYFLKTFTIFLDRAF